MVHFEGEWKNRQKKEMKESVKDLWRCWTEKQMWRWRRGERERERERERGRNVNQRWKWKSTKVKYTKRKQ